MGCWLLPDSNKPLYPEPMLTSISVQFHNAPVPYPTIHHIVTEMCTFLLQNGALQDICPMHCRICEMGLLQYGALWDMGLVHFGICVTGQFSKNIPALRKQMVMPLQQRFELSLDKLMACPLLGAKPLPEPIPIYSQLDT